MAIYITCGRCGNYLGSAPDQSTAAARNAEHLKDCDSTGFPRAD